MYSRQLIHYSLLWQPINVNTVYAPYRSITVKLNVPKLPGVYLLYNLSNNGLYYPFYVGESNNLQRRLLDHLADYESVRRYRCGFRYALMPRSTKEMRRAAEAAIYYAHPDWFPYNDESKLSKNGTYIFDLGL